MRRLVKAGKHKEALQIFESVPSPDGPLYNVALSAYCKASNFDGGRALWQRIPAPWKTVVSYSTMIDLCRRNLRSVEAQALWKEMHSASVEPNIITCNSLLSVYGGSSAWAQAVSFFSEMRQHWLPRANPGNKSIAYTTVMSAVARRGDSRRTLDIFEQMTQQRIAPEHAHVNSLITSCAKHAEEGLAQEVFEKMRCWRLKPRMEDFTALIACCRYDLARCHAIVDEMEAAGVRPNQHTYDQLATAHVLAGDCGAADHPTLAKQLRVDRSAARRRALQGRQ